MSRGMPSRPAACATNGLLDVVTVLQHDTDPTLHWLWLIAGGELSPLASGVAAAEAPVATANAAMKETRVLESIMVRAVWSLW